MTADLLELQDIGKSFPGVRALDGASLQLRAGEVLALTGENGAGKSTLVKILSGVYRPDRGAIRLNGEPVQILNPAHARAIGISPVHQELSLEPFLSVAENVFLGQQPTGSLGLIDRRRMKADASRLISRLAAQIDVTAPVESLSVAQRQIVAIARATATDCRILIFDEPTASLTERETAHLFDVIRRLREEGLGIIYISHRLEEVFRLCDRVMVLRDGRHVATMPVADTDLNGLIGMMIGRDVSDLFRKRQVPIGAVVLDVRRLTKRGMLHDVSLTLRRGEIVGVAGLVGAGRTELARAIFGDLPCESGEVRVDGVALGRGYSVRAAIAAGIGLVPEDRKEQGLVIGLSVQQNVGMAMLGALSRAGIVSESREKHMALHYVGKLAIKTPSVSQRVMNLSGGNQQRVVVAKWLATRPKVLLVDEPTRGIDVGATAEIHGLLCELAAEGVAVLMISSDMREILAMSDRILVMHQGRISGELPGHDATQEAIMHLATGQVGSIAAVS
jgi:ABC-type sugar transport system ATPase subunit